MSLLEASWSNRRGHAKEDVNIITKPALDSKPVRRVIIEGAPGAGKSTLAWELCHK